MVGNGNNGKSALQAVVGGVFCKAQLRTESVSETGEKANAVGPRSRRLKIKMCQQGRGGRFYSTRRNV